MNEFDLQSLRKKIKREPIEVNITLFHKYSISYYYLIFTIIYIIFRKILMNMILLQLMYPE